MTAASVMMAKALMEFLKWRTFLKTQLGSLVFTS